MDQAKFENSFYTNFAAASYYNQKIYYRFKQRDEQWTLKVSYCGRVIFEGAGLASADIDDDTAFDVQEKIINAVEQYVRGFKSRSGLNNKHAVQVFVKGLSLLLT